MFIDPQMWYYLHQMMMHLFSYILYLITTIKKSDSLRLRRLYHVMHDKLPYKISYWGKTWAKKTTFNPCSSLCTVFTVMIVLMMMYDRSLKARDGFISLGELYSGIIPLYMILTYLFRVFLFFSKDLLLGRTLKSALTKRIGPP